MSTNGNQRGLQRFSFFAMKALANNDGDGLHKLYCLLETASCIGVAEQRDHLDAVGTNRIQDDIARVWMKPHSFLNASTGTRKGYSCGVRFANRQILVDHEGIARENLREQVLGLSTGE